METRPVEVMPSAVFKDINLEEWPQLLEQATRLEVSAGDAICLEGTESDAFFVLLSGQVQVSARDQSGRPQLLAQLGPGSVVGETSIFLGDRHAATISAASNATLLRLPIQGFKALLAEGNVAAVRVLFNIAQSLATRLQATDTLVTRPLPARTAPENHIIRHREHTRHQYLPK